MAIVSTTIKGGVQNATGTITLNGLAQSGGITVSLSCNNVAATVPASVTVAANANSATFTITSYTVTLNTKVIITASYGGVNLTKTITVTH